MDKNHWNVACSNCGLNLRLTVEEKDFGKTVEAICPKCRTQTKTTIGVPVTEEDSPVSPELEQKMMKLAEKITSDPEIARIIESIRDEGFGTAIAMGFYGRKPDRKAKVSPKVDKDGRIKVGTFTDKDKEDFKKFFKIDL